jgi:ABC-type phosphate/phosphonate transport system permease subunit
MYLVLVKRLELQKVTLTLLLTLMAILFLVLVSWWFQELGLSFLILTLLGSLMPSLWGWGFQKKLREIRLVQLESPLTLR